ncbi:hypothetical protein Rsub_05004 [Raphidocelis subcapitata]|uniref:Uncharacterized protein n=1 Tax=Raphidocelis subcapitata TaxID=307507 RepID=A0A2V0NX34_9CHLO|nr:hypothetical protein Rsub_05004 [Raphidocelis subcapitata]|eukprot:GBF91899.1 hypothetical protein Rsub_05004 [Raphidocelis subcapitata]
MEAMEAGGGGHRVPPLVELCLRAAAASDAHISQRRSVAALPPDLANELLRRLLARRAFDGAAHRLERFAGCVTRAELAGDRLGPAPAQALAWLASFRHLSELAISDAPRLRDAHLAPLAALAPTLRSLSLRGCAGVLASRRGAAAAAEALSGLTALRRLDLSHCGGAAAAGQPRLAPLQLLPALRGLTSLSLAGLQLDDAACAGLGDAACAGLRELDLSESNLSAAFLEGALGALTGLTSLRLAWCSAGALPLFGSLKRLDVSHTALHEVAHSGCPLSGEVRLEQLSCAGCRVGGIAEVALPAVLRASAPTLAELDAAHCCRADAPAGGPLWLLPALSGATRLRRLDLSWAGPQLGDAEQGALPPLAVLAATQLSELVLRGCPVRGGALGALLAGGGGGLSRLDVGGVDCGHGLDAGDAAPSAADDETVAAIAPHLPALRELDASRSRVEGLFGSGGGGDSGGVGDGGAVPWAALRGLRSLQLHGSAFASRAAAAALGDALGGRLTSLSVGRAGGEGLGAAALAALCKRLAACRELRVEGGGLLPQELEAHLPRLPRLERVALTRQNPLICDAPRLAPLARRLRRAAAVVVLDGAEVPGAPAGPADARDAAKARGPRRRDSGGGGGGGGGTGGGGTPAHCDQRVRYGAARLLQLRSAPAVGAGAAGVRGALLASPEVVSPDW